MRIIRTSDVELIDIYGALGCALAQSIPSDDRIIMARVREAHGKLKTILDRRVKAIHERHGR